MPGDLVESKANIAAILIAIAGFAFRIFQSSGRYLNPDETQLVFTAMQDGFAAVYRASLAFPYGPLPHFTWHTVGLFGDSELMLRLPTAIAGALTAYLAYRWVAETFDPVSGLAAAYILSFSPSLVQLSAEVRPYMFHALWMVFSLWCLERAFRLVSLRWMRLFGLGLLLALLSMYMSIWFTIAAGCYAVVRMLAKPIPKRLVIEWALFQAAAAVICGAAYVTHLSALQGSQGEIFAREVWLRRSYFHPESQTALQFLGDAITGVFSYLFANQTLGAVMIAVFLLGLRKKLDTLSLVLPLVVTAIAALAGLYPLGQSRHDAFIGIFLAAGVGAGVSTLAKRNLSVLLLAGAVLLPAWYRIQEAPYLGDDPAYQQSSQMNAALHYFSSIQPAPRTLVIDQQSAGMVKHYLCHDRIGGWMAVPEGLLSYECGTLRVLEVSEWYVAPNALGVAFLRARQAMPAPFSDPAWHFHLSSPALPPEPGERFGRIFVGPVPSGELSRDP